VHRIGEHVGGGRPAHDIYMHFYPNMLHARAAVLAHGRGLLWNVYQNCGQPFAAMILTGLLYPPHTVFLALDPNLALHAILAVNLVIGGIGAFWLSREVGADVVPAWCGALVFELCTMLHATTWTPNVAGPLAWWPATMACTERLVRVPGLRPAAGLALVLAVATLPGYPQEVLFACQLLVLRAAWEVGTRRAARPLRANVRMIGALAFALGVAGMLAGIQLLPALDVVRESVRNAPLAPGEITPTTTGWQSLRTALAFRDSVSMPLALTPFLVVGAGLLANRTRRRAAFYLAAAVLFLLLSFGRRTPLFGLYLQLPLATSFTQPVKFASMASFCLAVATALGLTALQTPLGRRSAWGAFGVAVAALVAVLLVAGALTSLEWMLVATALLGVVAVASGVFAPRWGATVVAVAIVVQVIVAPLTAWMFVLHTDAPLHVHVQLFARLRQRLTPQDRVYLIYDDPTAARFALMPKSATLFGVPSIQDYEPLVSRRYAGFLAVLETGRQTNDLAGVRYSKRLDGLTWRLLDLTAARYLVVDASIRSTPLPSNLTLVDHDASARVYENRGALPRARFVPAVEVVPDPSRLLQRLAFGSDDLARIALADTPPTPTPGTREARGRLRFVRDDPEDVVLHVKATAAGFLLLADQYFPAWRATVDGVPVPILRGNYAFRLVPVPKGASTVVFHYTSTAFTVGAVVSAAGAVIVMIALFVGRATSDA
jgi:hypothetical protein